MICAEGFLKKDATLPDYFEKGIPYRIDVFRNDCDEILVSHKSSKPLNFCDIKPFLLDGCILNLKSHFTQEDFEDIEPILYLQFNGDKIPITTKHKIGYTFNNNYCLNVNFVVIEVGLLSEELVRYFHKFNISVFTGVIKKESMIRDLPAVDCIITTCPEKIIRKPLSLPNHIELIQFENGQYGIKTNRSFKKDEVVYYYKKEKWPKYKGRDLSHIFLDDIVISKYEHSDKDEHGCYELTFFDHLINHSCSPNLLYDAHIQCAIAVTDIQEHDELTTNYNALNLNKKDFKPFTCFCGNKIKGFNHLTKKQQQYLIDSKQVSYWVLGGL